MVIVLRWPLIKLAYGFHELNRHCQSSGAVRGDHDAVCHTVGAQRESDRLARDEFPRLHRSGAEGRVPAAN